MTSIRERHFVREFTRQFIQAEGRGTKPWPVGRTAPMRARDLATVAAVLTHRAQILRAEPGDTTGLNSAQVKRIERFLDSYRQPNDKDAPAGWPTGLLPDADLKWERKGKTVTMFPKTLRLAESLAIHSVLMQVVSDFVEAEDGGGGGAGTKIPPTVNDPPRP